MGRLDAIEIQIRPDGYVTFSALSEELLELAAAICPSDPDLQRRVDVMRQVQSGRGGACAHIEEQPDGIVQAEQRD